MTTRTTQTIAAQQFADAFLQNDWHTLRRLLADDVAFRALLPPRIVEIETADEAVTIMTSWFDGDQTMTDIETIDIEPMSVKERVAYRFHIRDDLTKRSYRVEQHAYLTLNKEGKIEKVDLICSGWIPHQAQP